MLPVQAKQWAECHLVWQSSLPLHISPPGSAKKNFVSQIWIQEKKSKHPISEYWRFIYLNNTFKVIFHFFFKVISVINGFGPTENREMLLVRSLNCITATHINFWWDSQLKTALFPHVHTLQEKQESLKHRKQPQ